MTNHPLRGTRDMTEPEDRILVPAEIQQYLRITRAKFYYLASRGRLSFLAHARVAPLVKRLRKRQSRWHGSERK